MLTRHTLPVAGTLLIALAISTGFASHAGPHRASHTSALVRPTISHVWKPVRRGGAEVVAIEVRTEIAELPDSASRALSLMVPIVYAGVTGIAERTQKLAVRDADGEVALRTEDDKSDPSGFPYFRHFRATRVVRSPVIITYEALAPDRPMRAPPFGLFAAYGGVSGAGSGFLVLPENAFDATTKVHWDLSDLAAGATASTTFGDGDFTLDGAPTDVMQGWIMAGPLGRYPATGAASGFSAVWLGTPSFDAAAEMEWTAKMYAWLGASYGYLRPLPEYRVFIRTGARSGTALGSSFMAGAEPRAVGASASGEAPRETFAHEMGHLFVGGIEAPSGVDSWFSEGVNTFFTRLMPMRGGFTSVEEYGRQVNEEFKAYWTGVARNWSADSIVKVGFRDEDIRHMPYVRSSIYLADLDSRIRARSGGRRTIDAVLRELFEARARGERLDHDKWTTAIVRELGPESKAAFESLILKGSATLVPASDAFGPCFTRREAQLAVDSTRRIAGYEWVRVASIPDSVCRAWGEPPTPRALITRVPASATTKHTVTFGGVNVAYSATVEEQILNGPDGVPEASLVTIAYLRDDIADRARRPVTFVFNGGPGSSSSPLHMSGLGPRMTAGDRTIANPESVLDATDLVFIDPVGTGFSRPFTTEIGRTRYWTRRGDAASVAQAIRQWLRAHDREASPRYLAGESYGTVRAGVILRDEPSLRFDGVILVAVVAGALNDDEVVVSDAAAVSALPTMAASAWFHGVGSMQSRTVEEVFAEASRVADGEYRDALVAGTRGSPETRARVADRVARLIGVPTSFLLAHDLRLTKDDWMLQVLALRGLRTGMLDTRVTAPRDTTRRGGLSDPSFNGGRMRFGTAMLAPSRLPGESRPAADTVSTLERYLTRDLAFPTREMYRSLNLDINVVWDHEDFGDITPAFAEAMRARPAMRVFWTGGLYDLTTPAHAVERAFAAIGMPADRTTASLLPAAHGVFADPAARRIVAERLRTWLR